MTSTAKQEAEKFEMRDHLSLVQLYRALGGGWQQ